MRHDLIIENCQGVGEDALMDYISIAMANGYDKKKIYKNLVKDYKKLAPDFEPDWIKPLIEEFDGLYSEETKTKKHSIKKGIKTVTINGGKIGLNQLAKKTGIHYTSLNDRYKKGIRDERILEGLKSSASAGRPPSLFAIIDGEKYTVRELSDKTGLSINAIRWRLGRGEKGERLLRPQEKPRRIKYYGKVYERISDLMKDKGLSKNQVRYRLRTGVAEYMEEQ